MEHTELTYILAANKVAMELFKESKETLMNSNCYDFMVYRFSNWNAIMEELEEWEDYIDINESAYHELYSNICLKFRGLIKYL
ncbi:hypothetical protein [Seonamhaeicola maritimus]|uniref:Uncharacterized protein n=1 Tax=Seonamhaeicola maritimus TaxID=2591822 RepID=A0A5C7GMP7_9FLAO|nr:hypothetical protein [Seonamhaeicola maritimus]TXG39568.1 hypothetical protein FUA22_06790 [Seonamhaeicola maritimus]